MNRWLGIGLTAAMALVLTGLALWTLPILLTQHPTKGIDNAGILTAQNAARTACVAALVFLGAAATVYFTARTYFLTRRGQVTDRYTKSVQQLGDKELNVRLGGIYALEGLMRDSKRDQATIIEVLAAFVRDKACKESPSPPTASVAPRTTKEASFAAKSLQALRRHFGSSAATDTLPSKIESAQSSVAGASPPTAAPGADVRAALIVLGRRTPHREERPLDLRDCDLRGVDLIKAALAGARLSGSDLSFSILDGADLTGAWLNGAVLTKASLDETDLTGAWFAAPGIFDVGQGTTEVPLDDQQRASAKGVEQIRWVTDPPQTPQSSGSS